MCIVDCSISHSLLLYMTSMVQRLAFEVLGEVSGMIPARTILGNDLFYSSGMGLAPCSLFCSFVNNC